MASKRRTGAAAHFGRPVPCACGCGETLKPYHEDGRRRRYIPQHQNRLRPAPAQAALLARLREAPCRPSDLRRALGLSQSRTEELLGLLRRRGAVERVGDGTWRAA